MALSANLQKQLNVAAKSASGKNTITAAQAVEELKAILINKIQGSGLPPGVLGAIGSGAGMSSSSFGNYGEITMNLSKPSILKNGTDANLYALYNNGWTVKKNAIVRTTYKGKKVFINLRTTPGFCSQPARQFAQAAKAEMEALHPECRVTIIS